MLLLSLHMHPLAARLTPTMACVVRHSSSVAHINGTFVHALSSQPANIHHTVQFNSHPDLGAQVRRAKRLADSARQAEAEATGIQNPGTIDNFASRFSKPDAGQPRKFLKRNRIRKSGPAKGTERSRQAVSELKAAEAIMAFSQYQPSKQQEQSLVPTSPEEDTTLATPEPPNVATPELLHTNIKTVLNSIPGLTSLRHLHSGDHSQFDDYSQWQLDPQSYVQGARGPQSTYAQIILNRNPTITSESQKVLTAAIKRVAREI